MDIYFIKNWIKNNFKSKKIKELNIKSFDIWSHNKAEEPNKFLAKNG